MIESCRLATNKLTNNAKMNNKSERIIIIMMYGQEKEEGNAGKR